MNKDKRVTVRFTKKEYETLKIKIQEKYNIFYLFLFSKFSYDSYFFTIL